MVLQLRLPPEIILNVFDQLVESPLGRQPIFDPSSVITKTLRALTLTSRFMYPIASKYLYRYCLYLDDCVSYACFIRTMGIGLDCNHPQSLAASQAARNEKLWKDARIAQCITNIFISPMDSSNTAVGDRCNASTVRLPQVVDLCNIVGPTLKSLILDLQPVYFTPREIEFVGLSPRQTDMFLGMPNLEELVVNYDVLDYFHIPPPNVKRLATTTQDLHDQVMTFCFCLSTLQTLILIRPPDITAADIDMLFTAYKGQSLDVILAHVNSNHRTPEGTRDWTDNDTVRIWEVDVPTSFYGDDDDLALCENWIWTHAVDGTLWTQEKRRMTSWSEIQRRLMGPVHVIL